MRIFKRWRRPPTDIQTEEHARKTAKPLSALVDELVTGGLLITLIAVALAGLAVAVGYCIRWIDPRTQILLSGFTGPFDRKQPESDILGKEASDIFSDYLNEIIEKGESYSGSRGVSKKSRMAEPFDRVPQIPISQSYGLEIKGISLDQIIASWNRIRYHQEVVSGNIIPADSSGNKYVLYISWRMGRTTYHWVTKPFSPDDEEMEPLLREAAMHYIGETNPEIAGRACLTLGDYPRAIAIFGSWLNIEPDRPEPYLYLAKSFDWSGDYARAVPFADRAKELLAHAPRDTRERLERSINLSKSLEYFQRDKDPAQVSGFRSFVDTYLAQDPNALTNLGVLYKEKHMYKDAENEFLKALKEDDKDFPARLNLGESYEMEKAYPEAAKAFLTALNLNPTSEEAAEGYVAVLNASNNQEGASRYCSSWVFPEESRAGLVNDDERLDLYFLCAEAERRISSPDKLRLQWYFVSALEREYSLREGIEDRESDISTLIAMHDALCNLNNDKELIELNKASALTGIGNLAQRLKSKTKTKPKQEKLADDCDRVEKQLESPSSGNFTSTSSVAAVR